MIAVALRDYWPFNRRSFATKGTNPPYSKDDPRSFGSGVIKRLQLSNQPEIFGKAGGNIKEPQIGDNRTYRVDWRQPCYKVFSEHVYTKRCKWTGNVLLSGFRK